MSDFIDLSQNHSIYEFTNVNRPWKKRFKVKIIDITEDYV